MHRHPAMERRDYPCWAVVQPAPDIQGKWVAHCLEFDTLAQADDPKTAITLLLEGTHLVVLDDLRAGVDPGERRAASDDGDWSLLRQVFERPVLDAWFAWTNDEAWKEASHSDGKGFFVAQFLLSYERRVASPRIESIDVPPMMVQARDDLQPVRVCA